MPKRYARHDRRNDELMLYHLVGRHLFGTDDLHYGYWPDDLEVSIRNFPQAQKNFSSFLISRIPDGVNAVLDVGCGIGKLASDLMQAGYHVHGVSPNAYLTEKARLLIGDEFKIHQSRFEDLRTDERYDLILFSESFQYLQHEAAVWQCATLLDRGGYMLICDFFRTDAEGEGPHSGGSRLSRFREIIAEAPFEQVEDIDITRETSPTVDLMDDVMRNLLHPLWEAGRSRIESCWPIISRILKWKYGAKIAQGERRNFSGLWSGEHFRKLKSYRLLLYKKTS